jgi:hypothetical protein
MKTLKASLLTIAILLMTVVAIQAQTIRVVNNTPNAPSGENVFSTIQEAHDAADPGDIIHVIPSNSNYDNSVTITKQLTIYGIGFNPDKDIPQLSQVGNIILEEDELEGNPSGSRIEGLSISSITLRDTLNDILIRENIFTTGISTVGAELINGIELINNVFGGGVQLSSSTTPIQNVVIANNIFTRNSESINAGNFTLIQNNLFLGSGGMAFGNLEDCIVANNIFFGRRPNAGSARTFERNIFNNNLTFGNDDNSIPLEGSNTGSNNLEGVNPQFINLSLTSSPWDFSWDPGLEEGSPAIGAGTDGTDIGLFGGTLPFNSLYTGGTPLPLIQVLETTGVVLEGQDLQINVQARSN